jgi:hypothetical protein
MRPRISPVGGAEKDGPEIEFAENGLTTTYHRRGESVDGLRGCAPLATGERGVFASKAPVVL